MSLILSNFLMFKVLIVLIRKNLRFGLLIIKYIENYLLITNKNFIILLSSFSVEDFLNEGLFYIILLSFGYC